MKPAAIAFLFLSLSCSAFADSDSRPSMVGFQDRPDARSKPDDSDLSGSRPVVVDNADQIEIQEMISTIEEAFNSENVEGYGRCFKESLRKSTRRKVALLFASGDCSIDIQESHFIEVGDGKAEVAVRYVLGGHGGRSDDIVSTVTFIKEGGLWVVSGESLVSKSSFGRSSKAVAKEDRPDWNPYKPDPTQVSNNLQHLIGDIGVRPGMGCADGKCANGRCER